MGHPGQGDPEMERRNEQNRQCENTFTFPNTNAGLHCAYGANLDTIRNPKS